MSGAIDRPAARDPVLRVMPQPGDINLNGNIFGGWILSQMDTAGGIAARRIANGPVATVAIDKMEFLEPLFLQDLVSIYVEIERVGRTSITTRVEVVASREGGLDVPVTSGIFTFVALDDNKRPRLIQRG
ncbi:MAG: acyl-CoA thioesterase [Sphingomonadaceae bacterium]|nr:acyl-CoA thioesterase [Sphingomonadaceae bacterium]